MNKFDICFYQELQAAFTAEAASSGKPKLELSIAMGAGKSTVDGGYDVPAVGQYVISYLHMFPVFNFIFVMDDLVVTVYRKSPHFFPPSTFQ